MSNTTATWFLHQWKNPSDISTVLSIVGESGRSISPVAFSFGWVGNVSMMFTIIGNESLMPQPDYSAIVINAKTGYVRHNGSWVLGRMLRDYWYWQDADIEATGKGGSVDDQNHRIARFEIRKGLRLAFYYDIPGDGKPASDSMTWLGYCVAILQIGIAIVPVARYGEWLTLLITLVGTVMAFITGSLPIWYEEKLNCRKESTKNVLITAGNGAYDVIAILGQGGLDMEDLAACSARHSRQSLVVKVAFSAVALGWLVMIISVAGYCENTRYLLGIGIVGMMQNTIIASAPRRPETFGIHLRYHTTISDIKVMKVLAAAEATHPRLGLSLLPVFFPGHLQPREVEFWDYARRRADAYDTARTSDPTATICPLPSLLGNEMIPKTGFLN
ncbi:hypothetical protein K431DRAFT_341988 [Polychaeton citri CBS 116435]|uniref:Uncharacterized protein n=1 Tax=Polychaeton citri CBS 116435 TaxID=1314669 RepID=A0A9P4PYY9_9PEZI|nr:hypothetical protein K431DRAFT_341988 [Polychaeton citri CBS 116435]